MKSLLKFLKWTGILLVLFFAGVIAYIMLTWNKKYDAPYPDIKASTDSTVIARGKYLAYGPAHCGTCHVPMNKVMDVEGGEIIPLSGGWELDIPPGTFRAPNITPDSVTGIGKMTDGELARVLRHMVGADGRCIMPFMPFAELSDDDLTAIISFLRSQPPVRNNVPRSEYKFLGKAVSAFGMIKPTGTTGTPPKSVAIDSTAEYGKYIANYVANCVGCHTKRDMKTGAFTGAPFAGGLLFAPDAFTDGRSFISPNITPDPNTGIMASWTEATFLQRFRSGRVHKGSTMPWGAFGRMNDLEIKAVYRYLMTLGPVPNKIEKIVYEAGEEIPKEAM